ncbi:MAG: hypothetical protein IJV07_05240 [Alphaproteobacteria bacterium]|nr:hypothetical protein [Alphaproteobacteria bacterium]
MKKFLLIFVLFGLGACSYRNPLSDMSFQMTPAPPHVIANWYKIEEPGAPLKIYIEGDGNAFDRNGLPTDNPTPSGDFVRRLAADDPSPNVAYVGRPCQYYQGGCDVSDWTTARFSEANVNSMDMTIKALMKKAKTNKIILIGFSGGAQMAGLIAVRHPERIKQIVTVSGVLDQVAWAKYHGDSPLSESLNLGDKKEVFQKIPQRHYVGEKDTNVPPELVLDFAPADTVVIVPGAGHGTGFKKIYPEIYGVR